MAPINSIGMGLVVKVEYIGDMISILGVICKMSFIVGAVFRMSVLQACIQVFQHGKQGNLDATVFLNF